MVLLSRRKRFIFIKNRKVAGTSVELYFLPYSLSIKEANCPRTKQIRQTFTKGRNGIIGWAAVPPSQRPRRGRINEHVSLGFFCDVFKVRAKLYFKFCVIRNPFSRLVSLYNFLNGQPCRCAGPGHNHKCTGAGFKAFARRAATMHSSGKGVLADEENRMKLNGGYAMDYYIRFEKIEEGTREVCKRLDIPWEPSRLGHFRQGPSTNYRGYYDSKTRCLVANATRDFRERFGYRF